MINANVILQKQLAHSLGLDRYAEIMRGDPTTLEFQKTFNGYYRIRRNEEWRLNYYKLFNEVRREHLTFEQIITELYDLTGNIEASFSSKMLATIDDIIVLGHTGCGAVTAALSGESDGFIRYIVEDILEAIGGERDPYRACCLNVEHAVDRLKIEFEEHPEIGSIEIEGAVYDIENGKVKWI